MSLFRNFFKIFIFNKFSILGIFFLPAQIKIFWKDFFMILTLTYGQKCRKETHYSHNQQAASLLISARLDFGFYIGARHHRPISC